MSGFSSCKFWLLQKISLTISLTCLALLATSAVVAQNAAREYLSHTLANGVLEIKTSDGKIALRPYSDKIFELQFLTERQPANPPSWSVIKAPEAVSDEVEENESTLIYRTRGLRLEITKSPFQLHYYYKDKSLISENLGYFETNETAGFKFNLAEKETIYGGGERALPMNRRGYKLDLYNTPSYGYTDVRENMYYSLPLIMSSRQYMLLFDNAAKGTLDIGKTDPKVLSMSAIGGRKAYYLVAGDSYYDLNTQYTGLTGRQPLPPRWTLGNISSRFGYRTQAETEMTVRKYAEKSVPVDAMVIDLFWFGKDIKGHMGNLDWDYDAWPQPKKMMKRFKRQGVKTVLITEPFILQSSKRWREAVDANVLTKNYRGEDYIIDDFWFGPAGLIDIFKPESKKWFWNIYRQHMNSGVSAWWGDLGEPEKHPHDMVHVNGTADYVHNVYGHEWAKLLFDGYAKDYPSRRPMTLMRAGFAGSQRYGMVPWSGDVSRNWEGFKPQPVLTMQMGILGLAYMHSDLGGFAADKRKDGTVFSDPMLYTRWLQYGVFQPIFRPHSQESSPPEPIFWEEPTFTLAQQAVNLRYQLLPYNYTLAYQNATKGYPLMRPLFYDEPMNTNLQDYAGSYLWGNNILVAPVLEPKQTSQSVYFPASSNWVDFYSGKQYRGGSTHQVTVVDEHIPTFFRSGSFVPMLASPVQSTDRYSTDDLQLIFYADPEVDSSRYEMYDDDGKTHDAIKNNEFELVSFEYQSGKKNRFHIASNQGKYTGQPRKRRISLRIRNLAKLPTRVSIGREYIEVLTNNAAQEIKRSKKPRAFAAAAQELVVEVTLQKQALVITF